MKRIYRFYIPIILLLMTFIASNVQWGHKYYKHIILSDGKGYYAYLPAVFIYQDLHLNFFDRIERDYYDPDTRYDYRTTYGNVCINRYFVGTAVAMAPFFGIAHGLSYCMGKPMDGYSYYYPILISIAALFYLWLFLVYLRKLLRLFRIDEKWQVLLSTAFVFGTSLFYYVIVEPSMSHVYSLAFITIFLYHGRLYLQNPSARGLLYCAGLLGMILLIRPQNGIVLLAIPFLADGQEQIVAAIRHLIRPLKSGRLPLMAAGILIPALFLSLQSIVYWLELGKIWIDTYPGERFYWLDPEIIRILFSYKRGLFVYTPLTFLSLTGLYFLWKENRFRAWSAFLFLAILTYMLSSWWSWNYGGCFGLRAYIEFYPVFILLAASTLQALNGWSRYGFIALICLCTGLCQIQTYQYRYHQMYWLDMTKNRYWKVFLQTS